MGGSGGGVFGGEYTNPDKYKEIIEESRKKTHDEQFETTVNGMINERVSDSQRDTDNTREHLDDINEVLEEDEIGTIEMRFGGSVNKHTYVDDLSDVDVLVIINKTELSDASPKEVLNYIKTKIQESRLRNIDEISIGKLAVTVIFSDGEEIQLLPAIKKSEGYKIPSKGENEWSNVVRPDKFAAKLKDANQNCGGKVYSVIKIVKNINSRLPKDQQLKGYHIESLAVEVFKNYPESCSKTPKVMLKYFFEHAKDIVKTPITDKTNQSIHVDDYLGPENSQKRYRVGYTLGRVWKRMKNADEIKSVEEWESILDD